MTQREEILLYIKEHGSITPLDAYPLGITKLATRVSEMRKDGIILKHTMEKGKNKNGKPMRYMRYSFEEGACNGEFIRQEQQIRLSSEC